MPQIDTHNELAITEPGRSRDKRLAAAPSLVPLPALMQDAAPAAPSAASLQEFARILFRHKWKMLVLLAVLVAAAVVVQFTVPKVYEATATVKIDRHTASIDPEPQSSSAPTDDMDQIITTEMELAQSDPVLRPVAEKYNLWEVEKQTRGMSSDEIKSLHAAPVELKKLKVKRPPNSYLLKINYRAENPQLAAAVANAIAESLVAHTNDTARRSLDNTTTAVQSSLDDLRKKMDQDNAKLAEFEAKLGIVDPEQRATVISSRLKDLTTDLTQAQSDRVSREATMRQMEAAAALPLDKIDTLDKAQSAAQVADSIGLVGSTAMSDLVAHLNDAKTQFANAKSYYGTKHPEYIRAAKQLEELQSQIKSMVISAAERSKVAYRQAADRENKLNALVNSTKAEMDSMQGDAAKFEQLKSQATDDRKFYEELENRTRIANINQSFNSAAAVIFSDARPPQDPLFPKLLLDIALAIVLTGLLGPILAVLLDALDTKFSGPEEVANRLQVDVLAVVPESKWLPIGAKNKLAPGDPSKRVERTIARYKEAIRVVRTALLSSLQDGWLKTIQISSSMPGEGKSTMTASLAAAYAQAGKKVLLLDADMRRPTIHRIFEIPLTPGLSEVLEGEVDIHDAVTLAEPGLFVMPAGPISSRSSELISMHFASVLAKVARDYDLVLVDSPPVTGAAETLEISRIVDGTVLVVHAEKSGGDKVTNAASAIRRSRGQLLGLVMNRAKEFGDGAYSYNYYAPTLEAETNSHA